MKEPSTAADQIDCHGGFGRKGLRDALVDSDPLELAIEMLADAR